MRIDDKHPLLNIKPLCQSVNGLNGYKVQVTFKEPKSGKTLKTSSNWAIDTSKEPWAIAFGLMSNIKLAFEKMELRVSKEAKKAENSVKTPVQEFIEKMNA